MSPPITPALCHLSHKTHPPAPYTHTHIHISTPLALHISTPLASYRQHRWINSEVQQTYWGWPDSIPLRPHRQGSWAIISPDHLSQSPSAIPTIWCEAQDETRWVPSVISVEDSSRIGWCVVGIMNNCSRICINDSIYIGGLRRQ